MKTTKTNEPDILQDIPSQKVYLTGRIAGLPDTNKAKFNAAENLLSKMYMEGSPNAPHIKVSMLSIYSPLKLDYFGDLLLSTIRIRLKALVECDCVWVLDDWRRDRNSELEVILAIILGMPVYEIETRNGVSLSGVQKLHIVLNMILKGGVKLTTKK